MIDPLCAPRNGGQRGRPWVHRCPALVGAIGFLVVSAARVARLDASELPGRYVVASSDPTPATPSVPSPAASAAPASGQEVYGGTVDIVPRHHGLAVLWRPAGGGRKLHGLGLRDGEDALAISLATGGAAYGVQIYHRTEHGGDWRGTWITSIDSASSVGEISFEAGGTLLGRHPMTCRRPGAGSFSGTVDIAARGSDFLLTFYLERNVLYRGLGVLLDDNRLAVAWSFGSAPGIAVYRLGVDGLLTGRRVSLRSGQPLAVAQRLAREGEDATRLLPGLKRDEAGGAGGGETADLPVPAFGSLSESESAMLTMMEPGAPSVKAWNYDELQSRYGADGWADRWLAEQLTPEELRLLKTAVRRRDRTRARAGSKGQAAGSEMGTVGELIESERARADAADED